MDNRLNMSIVIPVYNVEEYIEECIKSVITQTLTNIEIIVINDGSTDNSLEKIKGINDNRIKLINKENGGLSSARNRGISEAKGQYVLFLDSDDFLVCDNCLKEVYELAVLRDVDMVECKYDLYNNEGLVESRGKYLKKFKYEYTDIDEYIEKLININFIPVCFKVFKLDVILNNNLKFKEGFLHEDEDFMPRLVLNINSIAIYNKPFYAYRIREGSITKTRSKKRTDDMLKISYDLLNHFNQISKSKNIELLKNRSVKMIFDKIYSERIKDIDNDRKIILIKNSNKIINKIISVFLYINFELFCYTYRIYILLDSIRYKVGGVLCQENN